LLHYSTIGCWWELPNGSATHNRERETCTHTATHTYMWSGRLEAQEMNVAVFPMHAWDARGGPAFLNPKPICVKPRFKWEICLGVFLFNLKF
jgi:hypothetical protein